MIQINILIDLAKDEQMPPEARAVQLLQNTFASAANMSPEELVAIWRNAVEEYRRGSRPKHAHRRKEPQ